MVNVTNKCGERFVTLLIHNRLKLAFCWNCLCLHKITHNIIRESRGEYFGKIHVLRTSN